MMPIEGVDYAWDRPSPAGLYAAGKRFAFRYLSYNTTGKNLTIPERDALWAAGLAICLNWENRQDDASDGYAGGRRNAQAALEQARKLGAPDSIPIYFSIDEDTSSNPSRVDAYLQGVRSVLPLERTGVYGGLATVQRAQDQRLAAYFWQTAAWSSGAWMKAAHVRQYDNGVQVGGADCDLDRAMVADFGQWTGDEMTDTDGAIAEQYRILALLTLDPKIAASQQIVTAGRLTSVPLIDLLKRLDTGMAQLLARTPGDLAARLEAILQAAVDDPASTVTMTTDEQAALAAALAAAIHVPSAADNAAEFAARLQS
jgi:hypothetical protein